MGRVFLVQHGPNSTRGMFRLKRAKWQGGRTRRFDDVLCLNSSSLLIGNQQKFPGLLGRQLETREALILKAQDEIKCQNDREDKGLFLPCFVHFL